MDNEFEDLFDDDGELAIPTMRGSANLDIQDYQGWTGRSDILDDELQEDVPSTPGRNPGAAPATDIEGTDEFDLLDVPGGMDAPGMKQTTFGGYPWRPGSASGYRPYSQQRAGMDLRALGDDDDHMPAPAPREKDSMQMEPEVIDAVAVEEPVSWQDQWHGMRNQETSNAEVDPMTLYDRMSYEYDDSSQNVIGNGIFDMEEGVTWRPRDGSFANQYAMPAYLADEDELGVQQSEMWDSTAGEWRVTQPSAGGIALARKVRQYKAPPSIFRREVTGPRSHIEAFGRRAAKVILVEAQMTPMPERTRFLAEAIEALGPGSTRRAKVISDRLVQMGYPQASAFEDVLAHLIMHAAANDLSTNGKRNSMQLPKLDRMSRCVRQNQGELRKAAGQHLAPIARDRSKLRADLGALYESPAGRALGEVSEEPATEAPVVADDSKLLSTRNILIAGGVGLGAYLLYANRKSIKKNIKKLIK